MGISKYVIVEKGIYYDGFLEIPLVPVDGAPINPTWRGDVWIDENTMRIAPNGAWSVHIYDYQIGQPTEQSVQNHKDWYSGYNAGKAQQRRRWPTGEASDYYKDGLRCAWEEKGKPFDNAFWKQYWRNR